MRSSLSFLLPVVASLIHTVVAAAAAEGTDLRDLPVTRNGSTLLLDNKPWKAVGPNVYWLGLDENVTPPEGEPFYEPLRASYPARGRVSEIMAVVRAMGGTMIRSRKFLFGILAVDILRGVCLVCFALPCLTGVR